MRKILIVDDDRVVLATLSMGLSQAGYQVFQASDGPAALQLEQDERPDLVILDMRMPGMSGLDVAHVLRGRGAAPFIFLSAFNDEAVVKDAADAGALGYLIKPVEIPSLVPSIEVAMMRHDELAKISARSIDLMEALNKNREIDIAIGLMMERYRIDRVQAFNALRNYARSNRSKVNDIALRLIDGEPLDLKLA